jgi:hypothetical protein
MTFLTENRKRWRNNDVDLDLLWERTFADTPDSQGANQPPNSSGAGQPGSNTAGNNKMVWPTSPRVEIGSGQSSKFGRPNPARRRNHDGVDIPCQNNTNIIAVLSGTVETAGVNGGYGNYILLDHGDGVKTAYAHLNSFEVNVGDEVDKGQVIALSDNTGSSTGPHLHFEVIANGTPVDPEPYLTGAETVDGTIGGGGGGATAGGESIAKAGAFATFFQLSSGLDRVLSMVLDQEKSLMNDKPLFPFVQQLTEASLRNFQSMPNGNFFAFYPDYFGGMGHRKPYWEIKDIEIIDGKIDLSDDQLATHVYVVGSTLGSMQLSTGFNEQLISSGVVTVFNAFMVDFLNGPEAFAPQGNAFPEQGTEEDRKGYQERLEKWRKKQPNLANKDNAIKFLEKYGARPKYEEMPMVRSPYYELFLAYQRFCMLWSQQFATTFQLTYMPELFPGGIVKLVDHGIQCYVESVTHNCSYTSGFTTSVVLSSPAAMKGSAETNVNQGLVREGVLNR